MSRLPLTAPRCKMRIVFLLWVAGLVHPLVWAYDSTQKGTTMTMQNKCAEPIPSRNEPVEVTIFNIPAAPQVKTAQCIARGCNWGLPR